MLAELQPRADELNAHRESFTAFLSKLDDAQWTQPVGDERYSARQTVAHLAGADQSMTRMAQNWIASKDNTVRADFDLDFFNARQQEKRAQLSNADLLADWQAAQNGVIALMETLTAKDLAKRGDHPRAQNISLLELFSVITPHEADHLTQVMNAFAP